MSNKEIVHFLSLKQASLEQLVVKLRNEFKMKLISRYMYSKKKEAIIFWPTQIIFTIVHSSSEGKNNNKRVAAGKRKRIVQRKYEASIECLEMPREVRGKANRTRE